MKIKVHVKTGSSGQEIIPKGDGSMQAKLKSQPQDGKANKELIELLADYFSVPKSCIKITSGLTSKIKMVVIE